MSADTEAIKKRAAERYEAELRGRFAFQKSILNVLGLKGEDMVTRIIFELDANERPRVVIHRDLVSRELMEIAHLMDEYEFQPQIKLKESA